MFEQVAIALIVAMFLELRVAVHRIGWRVIKVEKEQHRMKLLHVLPPVGVFVMLILLGACGVGSRSSGDSEPAGSAAIALANIGNYIVRVGAITGLISFLGFLFAFGNPTAVGVKKVATFGLEGSVAIVIYGCCILWMADNPWIAYMAGIGIVGVWIWYRWPSIRAWLARRKTTRKD